MPGWLFLQGLFMKLPKTKGFHYALVSHTVLETRELRPSNREMELQKSLGGLMRIMRRTPLLRG